MSHDEYYERRFWISDFCTKNSKNSYQETVLAIDLLMGDRQLKLVRPNHSFRERIKASWEAAKEAWNRHQHYTLRF